MSEPKPKKVFLKFYSDSWRADPKLRSCSLAARGLWLEMLLLMHEADPYGHLLINGKRINSKQLARLVAVDSTEIEELVEELEAADVFSRKRNGVIFNRRMVRDFYRTQKNVENGARGGNPQLLPPADPKPEPIDLSEAVDLYNDVASRAGLPKCQKLSARRTARLKKRLDEVDGIDGWRAALEKVEASDFCCGRVNGWKANFDFMLQESSFTKLMEGNYDNGNTGNGKDPGGNGGRGSLADAANKFVNS